MGRVNKERPLDLMIELHCMHTLALNSIKYEPLKHVNDKNKDLIG